MKAKSTYRGMDNPGTRLSEGPLAYLDVYKSMVVRETTAHIHAFDKAHAVMLVETGIISPQTGRAILTELRALEAVDVVEARAEVGGGIHAGEHHLSSKLGQAIGGQVHFGRSSGDLSAVGLRLTLRQFVLELLRSLISARRALLDFGEAHRETITVGVTHAQHAQPQTLGHWATMFEQVFARDADRMLALYRRINRSPAGAAIMTGSDFPLDRQRVCDLLGFAEPLPHTWDAILSHDVEMETAGMLAVCAQNLGRLADDLMLWSSYEFRTVELPDWFCGTSSIMPQKKNPDGLEDFKSLAAQSAGVFSMLLMTEKGATGITILERRNSDPLLRKLAREVGERLAVLPRLMGDLRVDRERMARLAGANWSTMTDLAAAIARHTGIDWRSAHELVGGFVRYCVDRGITPEKASTTDLDAAARSLGLAEPGMPAEAFAAAMDPAQFVARRKVFGGPSPQLVGDAIVASRAGLSAQEKEIAMLAHQVEEAAKALERAIDAIVKDGAL